MAGDSLTTIDDFEDVKREVESSSEKFDKALRRVLKEKYNFTDEELKYLMPINYAMDLATLHFGGGGIESFVLKRFLKYRWKEALLGGVVSISSFLTFMYLTNELMNSDYIESFKIKFHSQTIYLYLLIGMLFTIWGIYELGK